MKKILFLLPLLALAACGSSAPPESFAPLDYSYLPPINFKVATLNVVNNYVPGPDELSLNADNPAPPATTLMAMLNQRMQPSGQAGSGTVTVQVASVNEVNGNLNGQMTVDINLTSADGSATGFAEATAAATIPAPGDDDPSSNAMRAALYQMTQQLMTTINVQLPYEIAHNIPTWVAWTTQPAVTGSAPGESLGASSGVIQATPLTGPPGTSGTAASAPPGTPGTPGTPVNVNPAVPDYLPGAGPAALTPPPLQTPQPLQMPQPLQTPPQ